MCVVLWELGSNPLDKNSRCFKVQFSLFLGGIPHAHFGYFDGSVFALIIFEGSMFSLFAAASIFYFLCVVFLWFERLGIHQG